MEKPSSIRNEPLAGLGLAHRVPDDFSSFIRSEAFPCVGAKSALALGSLSVFEAGEFASDGSDGDIHRALAAFGGKADQSQGRLASLALLFRRTAPMSEEQFERTMWARLQGLHDIDAASGAPWASNVARDPTSPEFSFSVGGVAYFVVGLHPGASRAARRFCRPAMMFNPHQQFERLRQDGRYFTMQSIIRNRDIGNHGSINPMLSDFGRGAAAAQYSGRRVDESWVCPLRIKS